MGEEPSTCCALGTNVNRLKVKRDWSRQSRLQPDVRSDPKADELLRANELSRRAMCGRLRIGKDFLHAYSIGRSSHVFGLRVRHAWPLAIMPSADQVPVKNSHSTMRWPEWVVLIARSTGSALRAVCPFQSSHHVRCPTRSLHTLSAAGCL